ncbi:ACT domain-containing protein [Segnochrobactraceae bacterium EtOH-i3]
MALGLKLRMIPGRYAVARLPPEAPVPAWVAGPGFRAVVWAEDELTLVCAEARVPAEVEAERDWVCLRTLGPFDFQASGIVHALIGPLSTNGIGVFVVCTFDGEHLLVAARDATRARTLLEAAGHVFVAPAEG